MLVSGLKGSQSWEARALEPGCKSTGQGPLTESLSSSVKAG